MKIVIAIDSFKGSLTSLQAGNAVKGAGTLDGPGVALPKDVKKE